jgi:hypothetical protein
VRFNIWRRPRNRIKLRLTRPDGRANAAIMALFIGAAVTSPLSVDQEAPRVHLCASRLGCRCASV